MSLEQGPVAAVPGAGCAGNVNAAGAATGAPQSFATGWRAAVARGEAVKASSFALDVSDAAAAPDAPVSPDARPLTIGQLEQALLQRFPGSDAEDWDRTGMLVGDAAAPVRGVCVALDPTVDALRQTAAAGANVLVTHHPLFLDPPVSLAPPAQRGDAVGARVWEAVRLGVSVISFHTALDVSVAAAHMLPGYLGLRLQGILEVVRRDPDRGYGQICTPAGPDGLTLGQLARRCEHAFASVPRVWGNPDTPLTRVVTCTGAAGDDLALACDAGIDCVVAGEVRYHKALDAVSRGLCVVELGHDISEHPLCSVLVSSVLNCGIDAKAVRVLARANNWRSGATDGSRRI